MTRTGCCFAALYLAVIGWRLGEPSELIYDEALFIQSARQFIDLKGFTTWDHPPLGPLLSALFILLFGDTPTVWRLPSLLAGLGTGLMCLDIIRRLGGTRLQQGCVALMFLCDGLYFTMARIGIPNALMVFFGVTALWRTVVHFWSGDSARLTAMAQVGVAFGLACATKWAAVGMVAPIITVILVSITSKRCAAPRLVHVVQMFGILPLACYLLSFVILPFLPGYSWVSVFTMQYEMLMYHLNEVCNHRYVSHWSGWPLLMRPIWFHFQRDAAADINVGVMCLGNPAVFLFTLCGGAWALYRSVQNRSLLGMLVIVGYLSNWLLWVPMSRATYFHYIYPAQIFGTIAAGSMIAELFQHNIILRRVLGALCLCLVIVLFVYFYPLYSALALDTDAFFKKMWRESWI